MQWIPAEVWAACSLAVDEEELIGRTCYGGLDLSSTLDLSAFVLVFPPTVDDPLFRVLPRFWVPETAMQGTVGVAAGALYAVGGRWPISSWCLAMCWITVHL